MIKPIIFSGPMVKAILDGDKTMTRRVIKPQPKCKLCYIYAGSHNGKWHYPDKNAAQSWGEDFRLPKGMTDADRDALWTPPCHGDDILWVRESWAKINGSFVYRADDNAVAFFKRAGIAVKWRPSIHMPKEAARIFLRVKQVSVERLQEISGKDIACEGVGNGAFFDTLTDRAAFRKLWDSLLKPADLKRYGWDANPWAWVISFERCEKPEAW